MNASSVGLAGLEKSSLMALTLAERSISEKLHPLIGADRLRLANDSAGSLRRLNEILGTISETGIEDRGVSIALTSFVQSRTLLIGLAGQCLRISDNC
jgi:hypothetical protein